VIATAIGGLEDIVRDGETGVLVPVAEAEPLAAAMLELARNPERVRAMGAAARVRAVERFPQERCTERTDELYRFWLNGVGGRNGRNGRNGRRASAAAATSASTKSHGTR
jgi:hypothetical protein